MVLFCAAIRRDSVYLLKVPFISQVQVFSCEILLISRLKRPLCGFSSHFCFLFIVILLSIVLSVSFLVAIISPPLGFSLLSSNHCIDSSTLSLMLASPLLPSFLDAYSLSTSSLGCNALCMVISFLVLWSIYLSSSRISNEVFIPSIRFLLHSFVSSTFLALLRYSFFHLHLFDGVSLQDALVFVCFFSLSVYYYYHYCP